MASFYISCPLYFEKNLVEEIKSFWFEMMDLDGLPTREPVPELSLEIGGVSLVCPEHLGYQINFFTKIAHRILIRIHRFPARFYDQFEKEMKVLPLPKWIEKGCVSLKIETSKSRINHERNLIESCTRALASQHFEVVAKEAGVQQIFIRIFRDEAIISLDTSGDHLHRRGYAVYRGEAPLRENLAALLAQQTYWNNSNVEKTKILDPFAGSGTTLFETAGFRTPNFSRHYSWLSFVNKPKMFGSKTWSKNYRWLLQEKSFEMVAVDSDEKAIFNIQENKKLFLSQNPTVNLNLKTIHADSEDLNSDQFDAASDYWIISNPPYGIRLQQDSVMRIFNHLEGIIQLRGAIILHPESMPIHFRTLKLSFQIDFANQGLNVKLSLFKRKE